MEFQVQPPAHPRLEDCICAKHTGLNATIVIGLPFLLRCHLGLLEPDCIGQSLTRMGQFSATQGVLAITPLHIAYIVISTRCLR